MQPQDSPMFRFDHIICEFTPPEVPAHPEYTWRQVWVQQLHSAIGVTAWKSPTIAEIGRKRPATDAAWQFAQTSLEDAIRRHHELEETIKDLRAQLERQQSSQQPGLERLREMRTDDPRLMTELIAAKPHLVSRIIEGDVPSFPPFSPVRASADSLQDTLGSYTPRMNAYPDNFLARTLSGDELLEPLRTALQDQQWDARTNSAILSLLSYSHNHHRIRIIPTIVISLPHLPGRNLPEINAREVGAAKRKIALTAPFSAHQLIAFQIKIGDNTGAVDIRPGDRSVRIFAAASWGWTQDSCRAFLTPIIQALLPDPPILDAATYTAAECFVVTCPVRTLRSSCTPMFALRALHQSIHQLTLHGNEQARGVIDLGLPVSELDEEQIVFTEAILPGLVKVYLDWACKVMTKSRDVFGEIVRG